MILEVKDIRMSYANARKEVFNLLNGVDMAVEEGKVTALIGGNGAGKTTLFNIVSGFEKGFKGQVILEGNDISRLSAHKISLMGLGRLFQGRQLMDDLTLMENMKIASNDTTGENPFDCFFRRKKVAASEAAKEQQAIDILKKVFGEGNKYLKMLDHKASELSYGEQRLIAMARLLIGNDRLLLLDEPTSGVNPRYIDTFRTIIRDMVEKEGQTVLLIEHNMSFVRSVADHCHYLADGKIIKSGPTAEVLDDPVIRKDYLGL
jgi:branched-chain amino acid transport system ATP-binding protein